MIGQTKVAWRRRVAGIVLAAFVGLALVGIAVAGPSPPPSLTLNLPLSAATVTQNDSATASLGCTFDANRGYGFVIDFSWTAPQVKVLKHYELVLQHGTSTPALDVIVTGTSYRDLACNAFVIDGNLTGWHWQVSALGNGKKVVALSESRPLSFAQCRLASTAPCSAP